MPELPEVEMYRRLSEAQALGRVISEVATPDPWYVRHTAPEALLGALEGRVLSAARRRGKLLLLDVGAGDAVLGLRFGMTGRLVVDGRAGVGRLLHAPGGCAPAYERFTVRFTDGGVLAVSDPRRLGGVELDPDEDRLGPDALTASVADLRVALAGSHAPLKARLLDQSRLAGIGNLTADEILWRAALSPLRPAGLLTPSGLRRLHSEIRSGIAELIDRGGSHTGDLGPSRRPGGTCPKDGTPLARASVGGRTTWWCPRHQK